MGAAEQIKKETLKENQPISFKLKKCQLKGKEVKLKKDGTAKLTPCNSVKGDPHEVYPIKKKEDIDKIKQCLRNKIDNSTGEEQAKIAGRNLMLWNVSINIGLRMSDIVSLTWGDIFDKGGDFKESIRRAEKKTGKFKTFFLNESCKNAINNYIEEFQPTILPDLYLFRSREGGSIEVRTVGKFIKDTCEAVGIRFNVGTHTCRKTWCYAQIMAHQNDALFMAHLMHLLNHSSISATLHYAGLEEEQDKQYYNDVNL